MSIKQALINEWGKGADLSTVDLYDIEQTILFHLMDRGHDYIDAADQAQRIAMAWEGKVL